VDTPATYRYLFYPPAGHSYGSLPRRLRLQPGTPDRCNAAWAADLAFLAYGQDGETPMGWPGVAERLRAIGFYQAVPIGNWESLGTQGYLAFDGETAVLAFRGTEPADWTDMAMNFGMLPSAEQWESGVPGRGILRGVASALSRGALVHGGFQRALNTVWPAIVQALEILPREVPLLICGHSLGGALGHLAAARVDGIGFIPYLYTFGAPRVGNRVAGQQVLTVLSGRAVRTVNEGDPIAAVPPIGLGYEHAPAETMRLDAAGAWSAGPDDATIGPAEVTRILTAVALFLAANGDLDSTEPPPRLVSHSPGRYLARIRFSL